MTRTIPAMKSKGQQLRAPVVPHLSLEEEVLSIREVAPQTLNQIPSLFAESVVASAMKVLGEETGEALIRCIGDSNLKDPAEVYAQLDSFLLGGSAEVKQAIVQAFTNRVHRLYALSMKVAMHTAV